MIKTEKKKQSLSGKVSAKDFDKEQLNEKIRQVAYEIYLKRGSATGNELGDWLEAEKIVKKSIGNYQIT